MSIIAFFITCAKHHEGLLMKELQDLGLTELRETVAGVYAQTSLEDAYRVILESRLAHQVLLTLHQAEVDTPDDLYHAVQSIQWTDHFDAQHSFRIDVTGQHKAFSNPLYAAQRAKDAMVDQFRAQQGTRPSIQPDSPDLYVHLHFFGQQVIVYLSLSGESLHRRGYRQNTGPAPMRETLAAAVLIRAGWPERLTQPNPTLWDPFCGSGTLVIEAALMAYRIAPGLLRTTFGFTHWKGHQPLLWAALYHHAKAKAEHALTREDILILGSDHNDRALEQCQAALARISLDEAVALTHMDATTLKCPKTVNSGLLVTNPPYGERMLHDDLQGLSRMLRAFSQQLIDGFQGWTLALFSGAPKECLQAMPLRPRHQYTFLNGTLPCKLYLFEIHPDAIVIQRTPLERRIHALQAFEAPSADAHMFENRLRKNAQHLQKWASREEIHSYRVYDADLPNYAAAIDFYEGQYIHIQEYEAPSSIAPDVAQRRLFEMLKGIERVLEIPQSHIFLKTRRIQKGISQYEKLKADEKFYVITEGQAQFWVNFEDYLDTGIFLDHRHVRQRVAEASTGKRLLNLFCYTGTASIQAICQGAQRVVSVDLSNTYLDWAERNLDLNQHRISTPFSRAVRQPIEWIQADCLAWLQHNTEVFDVIFMNPPVFSNSARMQSTLDIQRDHVALIEMTMRHLTPQGMLIFSCNLKNFKLDRSLEHDFDIRNISKPTLAVDFTRDANRHHVFEIQHRAF